jgi:hypothetical protein
LAAPRPPPRTDGSSDGSRPTGDFDPAAVSHFALNGLETRTLLFAIASRLLKTRPVTVRHPCGVGDLTVDRIAGFDPGPVATGPEYRRYLRTTAA